MSILVLVLVVISLPMGLHYYYPSREIIPDLAINLIAGSIIFVIGLNWDKIRALAGADFIWLRCVFGRRSLQDGKLNIALDTYRDIRLLPENEQKELSGVSVPQRINRFFKTFPDGHVTGFPGAFERLMGYCSARASSYLIEKLSPYYKRGIVALSDEEAASVWEGTFINLGSSTSNIKTDDIKHHHMNKFIKEDTKGGIELSNGQTYNADSKHDVGMIFKFTNPYFEGYSLIICAGLGEWGTSGAAWYLSRNWRKLGRKYFKDDFIVIVNVLRGSDESASEIYSSESWIKGHLMKYLWRKNR